MRRKSSEILSPALIELNTSEGDYKYTLTRTVHLFTCPAPIRRKQEPPEVGHINNNHNRREEKRREEQKKKGMEACERQIDSSRSSFAAIINKVLFKHLGNLSKITLDTHQS